MHKNLGTFTTGISERYPSNSLESIVKKLFKIYRPFCLQDKFENIDDEKEDCENENCVRNNKDEQRKTTIVLWSYILYYFTLILYF